MALQQFQRGLNGLALVEIAVAQVIGVYREARLFKREAVTAVALARHIRRGRAVEHRDVPVAFLDQKFRGALCGGHVVDGHIEDVAPFFIHVNECDGEVDLLHLLDVRVAEAEAAGDDAVDALLAAQLQQRRHLLLLRAGGEQHEIAVAALADVVRAGEDAEDKSAGVLAAQPVDEQRDGGRLHLAAHVPGVRIRDVIELVRHVEHAAARLGVDVLIPVQSLGHRGDGHARRLGHIPNVRSPHPHIPPPHGLIVADAGFPVNDGFRQNPRPAHKKERPAARPDVCV